MKSARWIVAGCMVILLIALLRPDVTHLALRGLLVLAVVAVAAQLLTSAFARLPRSPFALGWRRPRAAPPELPLELTSIARELRASRREVPRAVVGRLSSQFTRTLAQRYRLDAKNPAHDAPIRALLSPVAAQIVLRRDSWTIPSEALVPLLQELEHL